MKNSILWLLAFAVSLTAKAQIPEPAYEIAGRDTVCNIFVYSPDAKSGLHVAYLTDKEQWQDIGKLCGSNYGSQGGPKLMRNPYVVHAADGTWRLLFSVNDQAPCLAASYSEDLVTWRPQDFPRMKENGVRQPVMFQMDDGTFDIYFKAKNGTRRYVKADKDFRHFDEAAEPSSISDDAWIMDTATVAGNLYDGNLFEVPKVHLDYLRQYFHVIENENRLCAERMADDTKRFANLEPNINATLIINLSKAKAISDKLVGVSLEDFNHATDGGLYAEMVRNRDFEYSQIDHKGWEPETAWLSNKPITIKTDNPFSQSTPHYAVLAKGDTLYNAGWGRMTAAPMEQFDFSVCLRTPDGKKNQVLVALIGDNGEVYVQEKIRITSTPSPKDAVTPMGNGWQRYSLPLVVDKKAVNGIVRLALTPLKDGTVDVDMVSLFPHDTFKGHGMRKDLVEAIAALHPKFVRFPGGCTNHKPDFHEYLQLCEDIGAEPLPVFAANKPACCQEILDMIDWANGDPTTSEWAKKRVDAGHPTPFNLKYIAIGNDDHMSTAFEEQFLIMAKTIKQKYPNIMLCCPTGSGHYPSADYTEGWKFAKANLKLIDIVDEHYHELPGWFMHHQDYYDGYDRKGPKVSLGKWASQGTTMENALVEALHLCAIERNVDVVRMASYADSMTTLTPSYQTQQLWGNHSGNTYVSSELKTDENVAYRIGVSVVKDASGKTIVKLVNALPSQLTIAISGLPFANGTLATGFTGKPSDTSVKPISLAINNQKITMPAYSVVVVEN